MTTMLIGFAFAGFSIGLLIAISLKLTDILIILRNK